MELLRDVVGTLQRAAAESEHRGALVGVIRGDGTFDLRLAPGDLLQSPHEFLCALQAGLHEADASAIGVVLPVRSIWGEDQLCDYLDAEAVVLVAAENVAGGVGSVGVRCAMHELPGGWEEAHEALQWIAQPLRRALARRPVEETETP